MGDPSNPFIQLVYQWEILQSKIRVIVTKKKQKMTSSAIVVMSKHKV